jgi:8-amino-3,8-dideoxy-alpha-D-manno-octulosonate transaminase
MCGSVARIDEIKDICRKKGLILIEDACQAFGATYRGRHAGTFGSMGCFSFDSVKTITCGEGGAVITDDEDLYRRADQFSDHGHDHIGTDRGLEDHPMAGYNYRISELNAAVGLAQIKKIDDILKKQRENKAALTDALSKIPGVSMQDIPDREGDSATFLSFFLEKEEIARQKAKDLSLAGVDGCFYWYDNNWHYIRQWPHLLNLQSPARLPSELIGQRPDFERMDLSASHGIMGRTISMQIKLGWSAGELEKRIKTTTEVLKR